MTTQNVPLFPLRTVLFPDGPLPLRVFEPRYLDMVSRCMQNGQPFAVVLLADGPEAGTQDTVSTYTTGTLATISDWYQGTDGLLGVTALGGDRFKLLNTRREADGLNYGDIELIEPEPRQALPAEYVPMAGLLRAVIEDLGRLYEGIEKHYDDASWVGCRFAEILPMSLAEKQHCLEINDPLARLEFLQPLLRQLRSGQTSN